MKKNLFNLVLVVLFSTISLSATEEPLCTDRLVDKPTNGVEEQKMQQKATKKQKEEIYKLYSEKMNAEGKKVDKEKIFADLERMPKYMAKNILKSLKGDDGLYEDEKREQIEKAKNTQSNRILNAISDIVDGMTHYAKKHQGYPNATEEESFREWNKGNEYVTKETLVDWKYRTVTIQKANPFEGYKRGHVLISTTQKAYRPMESAEIVKVLSEKCKNNEKGYEELGIKKLSVENLECLISENGMLSNN